MTFCDIRHVNIVIMFDNDKMTVSPTAITIYIHTHTNMNMHYNIHNVNIHSYTITRALHWDKKVI